MTENYLNILAETIRNNWNNVIHYESEAGQGIAGFDYDQILNAISSSI